MADRISANAGVGIAGARYMTFVYGRAGDGSSCFITRTTDTGINTVAGVIVVNADFAFMAYRI